MTTTVIPIPIPIPITIKTPRGGETTAGAERVKVCHLSLTLSTGGLERLLVDFARFHDRDRYELHFVAFGDVGQPDDDIRDAGCSVSTLDCLHWSKLRQVGELTQWLRRHRVDILHTHNAYPHLYGTAAAKWARLPVVVHTRHGRRFGGTFPERIGFAVASRLVDRVVAVSDDTADLCRKLGWLNHRKVSRIWNGIDVDRFTYRGGINGPVAISVARLSAEKDIGTLLRAVRLVIREVPEFRLELIGDGPESARLERLSAELELDDCVHFRGERADVPELLAQAGFFVCSSSTEGLSLTLLEAMAVGLPIVATDVGGNPEIVISEQTGLLTPAGDPEALANRIVWMCRHRDRWRELGQRGRHRVEQHFSIRGMVERYERLYEELRNPKTM